MEKVKLRKELLVERSRPLLVRWIYFAWKEHTPFHLGATSEQRGNDKVLELLDNPEGH